MTLEPIRSVSNSIYPEEQIISTPKEDTRAIFKLLDCIYRLGLTVSSLKLDSAFAKISAVDETRDCTTNESWSYALQSAVAAAKVVAMAYFGHESHSVIQAAGEIPQYILQGFHGTFQTQKNITEQKVTGATQSSSSLEQTGKSLYDLLERLVQNSTLT